MLNAAAAEIGGTYLCSVRHSLRYDCFACHILFIVIYLMPHTLHEVAEPNEEQTDA